MKKLLITSLLLATFAGSATAQNAVNFTINGRITSKTCSVTGGTDKTINMTHKDISAFAGASTGTEVYGDANDFATVSCPATQAISVSYVDTAAGVPTNQPYLKNVAAAPAANVGVSVRITSNTSNSGGIKVNTGSAPQNFRRASGSDYTTMNDYKIYIHPSYYVTAAGVTPGDVQARMTLNITYP